MRNQRLLLMLLVASTIVIIVSGCATPPEPTVVPKSTPLPFPPLYTPPENPITEAGVNLGRELFFDPILSRNGDMACSTCHHPDYGFSDGRIVSVARPGTSGRNVSTLWNTGYNRFLLWDGRKQSLESQARDPLTLPHEMNATPEGIVLRLQEIPAYVALFEAAYGEDAITFENVTRAIATFQRTLISQDSLYDQYIAGNDNALTTEQQRGMDLFFSEKVNCSQCHPHPLFTTETFRVTGIPSDDQGRAAIAENGRVGAFKAPSLRNVALTAPYMHNGSMATLTEVVDFYAQGGGRAFDFPHVDPDVNSFEITEDEKADLVAFLHALTDESGKPIAPDMALSGLPAGHPQRLPLR